jgi:hypothetical protein
LKKSEAPSSSKKAASAPESDRAFVPRASSVTTTSATFRRLAVEESSGRLVSVLVKPTAVGDSLTSVTRIVKTCSVERPPVSVDRIRTE